MWASQQTSPEAPQERCDTPGLRRLRYRSRDGSGKGPEFRKDAVVRVHGHARSEATMRAGGAASAGWARGSHAGSEAQSIAAAVVATDRGNSQAPEARLRHGSSVAESGATGHNQARLNRATHRTRNRGQGHRKPPPRESYPQANIQQRLRWASQLVSQGRTHGRSGSNQGLSH